MVLAMVDDIACADQAWRTGCTICERSNTCRKSEGSRLAKETLEIYGAAGPSLGMGKWRRAGRSFRSDMLIHRL